MVNQQKGVQQDTAYSAVVVNDHMYPRPCLAISFFNVSMCDTYDHSLQLHYRQYLVVLLFADLPSLSPSFHEMIFILVTICD